MSGITLVRYIDSMKGLKNLIPSHIPEINLLKEILINRWGGSADSFIDIIEDLEFARSNTDCYLPDQGKRIVWISWGVNVFRHNFTHTIITHAGRAGGSEWRAGLLESFPGSQVIKANQYIIIFDSRDLKQLITEKRINSILDKLEKMLSTAKPMDAKDLLKPKKLQFYADWKPAKALAMISTIDQKSNIERWAKRNEITFEPKDNPILFDKLKGSEIKVFFHGKSVKIGKELSYPGNIQDMRDYLTQAWGQETFRILTGLSILSHQIGRKRFTFRVSELVNLLYGKAAKGQRSEMVKTIIALQFSQIHLIEYYKKSPNGKPRNRVHIFTPLTLSGYDGYVEESPSELELTLFPQLEETDFGRLMIPAELLKIRKTDFPLAYYVLLESKHAKKGHSSFKIDIDRAIQAAGIMGTAKAKRGRAVERVINKLKTISNAGIFERVKGQAGGYIELIANKPE